MDEYLREDPNVIAPIMSDSIYRIKCRNIENQEEGEKDIRKRRNMHAKEERINIEELYALIKEQTEVIMQIMKN
ncbi:hypothetical protein F8M41_006861 [Gigaspora margarita]|uniref:Uncharacterized protein n=1 Tax=Gigaspora margarita TaxID=4874 RepID=A0A8H3X745_GIGMA|nr:hypothetical protein F8M41_006861 [Gigaspora margarita]